MAHDNFRWVDLLDDASDEDEDAPQEEADEDAKQYIGTRLLHGILHHLWLDGTTLPVLAGGADDDDDDSEDDEDDDTDDSEDDDDVDEKLITKKQRDGLRRAHRQAARYRVNAKADRTRATAAEDRARGLLIEMAFIRAAGDRLADTDAAWKLVDKSLIKVGDDGKVTGADEAIDALIESHPFIATTDDDEDEDDDSNPFKSRAAGKPMTGKKRPSSAPAEPSAAALAKKYPAIADRLRR